MKILIVKLSSLGDVVQTLPTVKLLKDYLPSGEIHWIVEEPYAEILEGNPLIQKLISIPRGFLKKPQEIFKIYQRLRTVEYDLVLDFQGLLKSGILCGMARAKNKIGFSNHREGSPFFYTHKLPPYDPEEHALKRYLQLSTKALKLLGIEVTIEDWLRKKFEGEPFILEEEIKDLKRPYLVIVPEARWASKEWPLSYWEALLQGILNSFPKYSVYGIGTARSEVSAKARLSLIPNFYPLFNRLNLKQLVYLLRRAEAVITVDTGPMHIASLLDKPIVALFGPTAENRTGPWSSNFRVLKGKLFCQPCFQKSCPSQDCMKQISPKMVLSSLKEVLNFSVNGVNSLG